MSVNGRLKILEKETNAGFTGYAFVAEDKDNPEKTKKEVKELTKLGKIVFLSEKGDDRL